MIPNVDVAWQRRGVAAAGGRGSRWSGSPPPGDGGPPAAAGRGVAWLRLGAPDNGGRVPRVLAMVVRQPQGGVAWWRLGAPDRGGRAPRPPAMGGPQSWGP